MCIQVGQIDAPSPKKTTQHITFIFNFFRAKRYTQKGQCSFSTSSSRTDRYNTSTESKLLHNLLPHHHHLHCYHNVYHRHHQSIVFITTIVVIAITIMFIMNTPSCSFILLVPIVCVHQQHDAHCCQRHQNPGNTGRPSSKTQISSPTPPASSSRSESPLSFCKGVAKGMVERSHYMEKRRRRCRGLILGGSKITREYRRVL